MTNSQIIDQNQLINLRGGVAFVQSLREPSHNLNLQSGETQINYTLDQKISPVFYKYTRLGMHIPHAPQDIYVILPC